MIVLIFGVGGAVMFALVLAVAADRMAAHGRVPERLAVYIPGQFPAYVREDRARARARRGWGAV